MISCKLVRTLFFACALIWAPALPGLAANPDQSCLDLRLEYGSPAITPDQPASARSWLFRWIQHHKIAAFKDVRDAANDGETVPVILVNRSSWEKVKRTFQDMLGFPVLGVFDKKDSVWREHGYIRFPTAEGESILADRVGPSVSGRYVEENGKRVWKPRDINSNQIGMKDWKVWGDMRRAGEEKPVFELVFQITPEERSVISAYHFLRRASIYRARWAFEPDALPPAERFVVREGCETCYTFAYGAEIANQRQGMRNWFQDRGLDVAQVAAMPEARRVVEQAKSRLLSGKWKTNEVLNDRMLSDLAAQTWIKESFPHLTAEQRDTFVNYLAAYEISGEYQSLMQNRGFFLSGEKKPLKDHSHLVAVLIYTEVPGAEQGFAQGTWQKPTVYEGFRHDPNRHRPLPDQAGNN